MRWAGLPEDDRCEHATRLREPAERADGPSSLRCPNRATVRLYNGEQVQGQACGDCARKLLADHAFLRARPINGG